MNRRTIIYRGSIKSCNYRCTYCPFSKHPSSAREMERDREQWRSFVHRLSEEGERADIGALLVAPYGEALIHPWYWEGLAALTALPWMDAVGAQTNLSFAAEEALNRFAAAGGVKEKLRLWATFHPEMTKAEAFADRCRALIWRGVTVCAGAVGVPGKARAEEGPGSADTAGVLRELRRLLPKECYLWINRMDGMKRAYTEEEVQEFLKLDPWFYRELLPHPADPSQCAQRLMTEGDGRLRTCNISPVQKARWNHLIPAGGERASTGGPDSMKDPTGSDLRFPPPLCTRKRCSCYLAYGGRENLVNQLLFGPYPVFRIPRRPKAVFLDIVGTILPGYAGESEGIGVSDHEGNCGASGQYSRYKEPDEELVAGLRVLHGQGVPLFFATTLPYREAARRCKSIWHLFSGGVFSGGAQICMTTDIDNGQCSAEKRSCVYALEEGLLSILKEQKQNLKEQKQNLNRRKPEEPEEKHAGQKKAGYRILAYREDGRLYKITLCRAAHRSWSDGEAEALLGGLTGSFPIRYVIEDHCLQIISDQADKESGVRMICGWLGISPKEAFAAGDSAEDRGMCGLCAAEGTGGPEL